MNRQQVAASLIVSAVVFMFGTLAYCVTHDARTAPHGAWASVFLASTVLPACCIVGAAQSID